MIQYHDGLLITVFYSNTFYVNKCVQGAYVPQSLYIIGKDAFMYCTVLKKIVLLDSILRIGSKSCWGCCSPKSVNISRKFQEVIERCFFVCTKQGELK